MDLNNNNIELIDDRFMLKVIVSTLIFTILYFVFKLINNGSFVGFIDLLYTIVAFGLTLIISEIGYNVVLFYL